MLEARFWVGCLACYNSGKLIGKWVDLEDVPTVETEDIHPDGFDCEDHEELWCFDHEGAPFEGECSLSQAVEYAERVEDITITLDDEDLIEVFLEWERMGYGDDPSDFQDKYYGAYVSEEEFVEQLTRETREIPDWLDSYIDWEKLTTDVMYDFVAVEVGGGVHILSA